MPRHEATPSAGSIGPIFAIITASNAASTWRPRSFVECNREWASQRAPLRCRLQLAVASRWAAGQRPGNHFRGVAHMCGTHTCQNTTFIAHVRKAGSTDAAQESIGIAESTFDIAFEARSFTEISWDHYPPMTVEFGRLRFNAELPGGGTLSTETACQGACNSNTESADHILIDDASPTLIAPDVEHVCPSCQLHGHVATELHKGALRMSMPIACDDSLIRRKSVADRSVLVALGVALSKKGRVLHTWRDSETTVIAIEPDLGRFAQLIQPATISSGRDNLSTRNLFAFPFAVSADDALKEAFVWTGGPGPTADERNVKATSWRVPSVSLSWVLGTLVPSLAPNATEISLSVRRSAVVDSAWRVLMDGLSPQKRGQMSRLTVEWSPRDSIECLDAARSLMDEGFLRKGPILCDQPGNVGLSFKGNQSCVGKLLYAKDSYICQQPARSLTVAVQNRFPVSIVRHSDASAATEQAQNGQVRSFAVQLPDFYEIWIEANSESAAGYTTWRRYLDSGMHDTAFLVTLEPRRGQWIQLLSGAHDNGRRNDTAGGSFESDGSFPESPPGWTHSRHMVVPTTVFDRVTTENISVSFPLNSTTSNISTTPLLWVSDVLLGGRDVAHLVLRHPHFDINPWLATGSHARRFRRVWLHSSGGSANALRAGCNVARRWAIRLGYVQTRGSCSTGEDTTGNVDLDLVFDRLD